MLSLVALKHIHITLALLSIGFFVIRYLGKRLDAGFVSNRLLKNVGEAAGARQNQAKKRSLWVINEHFEPDFNAAAATQVVFQRLARRSARVLPHIIDTLLLVSGISLAWFYRLSPLMAPWLLIKLMLIVVYIILGIAAMRSTQPRTGDLYAVASLGTIALVVLLAVFKPMFQGTSI